MQIPPTLAVDPNAAAPLDSSPGARKIQELSPAVHLDYAAQLTAAGLKAQDFHLSQLVYGDGTQTLLGATHGSGNFGCFRLGVRLEDAAEVGVKVLRLDTPARRAKDLAKQDQRGRPPSTRYTPIPMAVAENMLAHRVMARSRPQRQIRLKDRLYCEGLLLGGDLLDGLNCLAQLPGGPLGGAQVQQLGLSVLRQISRKLARDYHPRRIVHRDVKPENILFQGDGRCDLGDLGLAAHLAPSTDPRLPATAPTGGVGTLAYMAPEAVAGGARGTSLDVWSLGLTLASLVLSNNPFDGFHDVHALGAGQVAYADWWCRRQIRGDLRVVLATDVGWDQMAQALQAAVAPSLYQLLLRGMLCPLAARRVSMRQVHEAARGLQPAESAAERAVVPIYAAMAAYLAERPGGDAFPAEAGPSPDLIRVPPGPSRRDTLRALHALRQALCRDRARGSELRDCGAPAGTGACRAAAGAGASASAAAGPDRPSASAAPAAPTADVGADRRAAADDRAPPAGRGPPEGWGSLGRWWQRLFQG